jgi:hypothetical protein
MIYSPFVRASLDDGLRLISFHRERDFSVARKNEAAGAADAGLCHTEGVCAGKVRYPDFALPSANSLIISKL